MKINASIFKAYDIRGKYPEELNKEAALQIGQAFSQLTRAKKILVGRDNRLSSEALSEALISGIANQGVEVLDIGLCSTPAFYFAVNNQRFPAGLMVTASHLEKQYNGLKGVLKNANPLEKSQVIVWRKIARGEKISSLSKAKKVIKKDIRAKYIAAIRKHLQFPIKKFKVIMDSGNGMAGLYLKAIFEGTSLEIIPLFWKLDGNFPNRGLDPRKEKNRKKLAQKIKETKADFGFIWDGDGDRFFVLDARGKVIDPNFVSALIAKYLIKRSSKKKVVIDIRTSRVVKDEVKNLGGEVIVTRAWHPGIKSKMRENPGAIFGAETSGHYVLKNFYYIDDGILASIYFLGAISAEKRNLDEILEEYRNKYFIIEEKNFEIPNRKKGLEILAKLKKYYKNKKARILKIDGLSCEFEDWRFNLRPSETEPVLRLNLEANSKTLMGEKAKELSQSIINNQ